MKSPFSLPLYLISFLILFLLLISVFAMAAAWLPRAGDAPVETARGILERSSSYVLYCLPAALLPAIFLTALRAARNPVSRPFTIILPAATAFCVLTFGSMGLRLLGSTTPSVVSPASAAAYLRPGVLTSATGAGGVEVVVLASRVAADGGRLDGVVVARPVPPDLRLEYVAHGSATVDADGALLRLEGDAGSAQSGGRRELRIAGNPAWARIAEPSGSTAALIRDLGYLNVELERAGDTTQLNGVLLSAGLAAFLCFSTAVLRMTRWPLLGFVALGSLWRGALAGIRFVGEVAGPALAPFVPPSGPGSFLVQHAAAIGLLVVGAVFLVLDLLFVPFDLWKREIDT